MLATVAATLLLTGLSGAAEPTAVAPSAVRDQAPTEAELVDAGRDLYLLGCVSCHGADGTGQRAPDGALRGPSLLAAGEAGAYYQLTTGRMPLANSDDIPQRKPRAYTLEQIDALVAYVASLGDGPALPEIDIEAGDLAEGGVLFRENCQACHSATGAGGALSYGRAAPPLGEATPSQVGAAVRSGPGQMPRFGEEILDDEQLDGIAAYVDYLEQPDDRGGIALGRLGPIPEGFLIWVGGLGLLLVVAFWLGTRRATQPQPPTVATAADAPVPAPDATDDPVEPVDPDAGDRGCLGCDDADATTAEERAAAARRAELAVASGFLVSTAGAIGLAVVYWQGGQPQLEGLFLALALGGLGLGLILWAKRFMPHEPVVEERHPVGSTEAEIDAFRAEFEQGEVILTRRRLLVRTATLALGALGAALLFPLRSLGPRPGRGLKNTPFDRGVYIVTADNARVRAEDINVNGVLTVFPEVEVAVRADGVPVEAPRPSRQADAPTVLIRPSGTIQARPGREGWTPDGLVAYSKLCTHVGCPVGLYQADEHLLLCPCHQSTFDVLDGARPVFGPATRSLPQLPLEVDEEGYLYAGGDFSGPTGAGFWDRDR